ncbi:hypothetical protein A6R70_21590 [Agrobacterium rubi]|nr:hypothetical protein [Agrobacterium rubi]
MPTLSLAPALDRFSSFIPILRSRSFERDAFEDVAIDFVDQSQKAKALTLDFRGNGGGTTPLRLLAKLMDRPYRTWAATTCEAASQTAPKRANGVVNWPLARHSG